MLFNSWQFGIFLPVVFVLYWSFPYKFRWIFLLLASYYFYMSWNVKYVVLILFTTIISYLAAIFIERYEKSKKYILFLTLILCLGVLFIFKYFNFFSESFAAIMNEFSIKIHPVTLKLLLPIGISFYSFQTLSYVIDVYKGIIKPEHNFGIFALFVSFFPQLVAGPIERSNNLLTQLKKEHFFNYYQATDGLKIMAWGFFKKLVIADNLAIYVDRIFDDIYNYKGFSLIIADIFFTIQIYCDFSGYSDIARGTAKLMGIELMENFNSPYFSQSVKEFWTRWHISLSTWFRDYLYIPLGGSRVKKTRHYLNIMITFLVSGLWHGANWTFVIWGGIHGFALILEDIFTNSNRQNTFMLKYFIKTIFIFVFCSLTWIFFRAKSIGEALYIFNNMFFGAKNFTIYISKWIEDINISKGYLLFFCILLIMLFIYDLFTFLEKYSFINYINSKGIVIKWIVYLSIGFFIVFFSPKKIATEFVYFQF